MYNTKNTHKTIPDIKPTSQDVSSANDQLNNILKLNSYGCVVSSSEDKGYLEVKVDLDKWKKLSVKEEKLLVEELAHSLKILGKKPMVKILDTQSNEQAAFEHNRVALTKFEF